jgi:reactive intermediate/imine deaminase
MSLAQLPLIALIALGALAPACGAESRPTVNRINPPSLSKPTGYTHLVETRGGRTLYISGQVAFAPDGKIVGEGDLAAQAQQVFENLKLALAAGNATLDNVVKITVFMTDVSQLQKFRDVRNRYFTNGVPASTLVQITQLVRPELLIEIEAIAVVE